MSKLSLVEFHRGGGYGSEDDIVRSQSSVSKLLLLKKTPYIDPVPPRPLNTNYTLLRFYGQEMRSLNARERHLKLMSDYQGMRDSAVAASAALNARLPTISDLDLLKQEHRFVLSEDELEDRSTPEKRMARAYYERLFKEYCLADMSQYRDDKIGLRWRIEREVIAGKGQFICGNKRCDETEKLRSYEVNFSYHENGQPKSSLVKLRVCPKCAYRLHYRKIKSAKEAAKAAKAARRASKSAKVSVPGEVKVSKKRKSFSETSERGSSGSESDADSEEKSATQVHKKSVIHDGQSVDPLAEWLPNQEVPSVQLAAQQSEAFAAGLRSSHKLGAMQSSKASSAANVIPDEWQDFESRLMSSLLV